MKPPQQYYAKPIPVSSNFVYSAYFADSPILHPTTVFVNSEDTLRVRFYDVFALSCPRFPAVAVLCLPRNQSRFWLYSSYVTVSLVGLTANNVLPYQLCSPIPKGAGCPHLQNPISCSPCLRPLAVVSPIQDTQLRKICMIFGSSSLRYPNSVSRIPL